VWPVEFVFLVVTALGVYRVSTLQTSDSSNEKIIVPAAGTLALVYWFYAMRVVGQHVQYGQSNYTESYAVMFNVLSVLLWSLAFKSERPSLYYLAIGLFTGLTFLLRPNNIGVQVAIVLVDLIYAIKQNDRQAFLKKILFLGLGAFLVIAAAVIWLEMHGAFNSFIDAVFAYNSYYTQKNQVKGFGRSYYELLAWTYVKFGWPPFVLYFVLLSLFLQRLSKKDERTSPLTLILLIGIPLETILSALSGRVFFHYMIIWTPYLAWMVSTLILELGRFISKPTLPKWLTSLSFLGMTLTICILLSLAVIRGYADIAGKIASKQMGMQAENIIVEYVVNSTQPTDKVLVWGNDVWINFMSKREAPTKYSYQFPLFMPGYTSREKVLGFLNDLQSDPPVLIVEPLTDTQEMLPLDADRRAYYASGAQVSVPDGMQDVFAYVGENYCVVKEFKDTLVYRLKSDGMCP
jgi:predicted small integral membrane protein